ncbi:inactive tyrosine-protein kinase 7 [Trichonephila inaurata madagascariensis]|uniref:Inactive tyrosine-protein kinase 7 n=1 Tax=Trichonephila inaurata madagascariensis TaxID=2747483 RepID=A0A8X6WZY7_9ARAC|nr:inactive tyrosine-protein kinase 7 [Trichonephila inaurata madagascariensis]
MIINIYDDFSFFRFSTEYNSERSNISLILFYFGKTFETLFVFEAFEGITDSIRVVEAEPDKDISIGDDLVLRCKADGNPETHVIWYRNGVRLFRNEKVSFKSNQLHITDLTLEDNGIYSCKAVNDVGSVNSTENFALKLRDGDSPYISLIPKDVIVQENGTAYFECSYENAVSTEWIFKNEHLKNSNKYTIYPNGSLLIYFVEHDDTGIYECKGKSYDSNFPDQIYAVLLQIAYIENLTAESLEPQPLDDHMVIVNVHGSFDITCLVPNGLPKPKMWWENPKGHVINDSGRIHVEDMRLIFSEVEESDDGQYSCIAENIADKRNVSFSLVVSAPPVIVDHPTDLTIDEGGEADFVCGFSNSSAVVYWLKDNIYLKDTGSHITLNDNNLTIRNVASSDVGTYHCEVKSEGFPPVFSEGAFLSVKEKLKFIPAPVNRKLELGSNAKIYCKAGGSTPPVVKWSRIDIRSTEWPPHIRDDNGTLHFNRVLSTDSGKYMCVATNSQGIINATIDVDVIVMPKFSVQPSDTVADEGDPVILHCLAEGDPVPIIQWDKNNELNGFNHKTFRVLENGSLFASEISLEDEGKYGCTAGNSGGLRRHEVTLIVKAKESTTKVGSTGLEDEEESTMTKTVAITLGAAGIYIVLVVGLMMWCRYRRAKRKALMLAQATADAENSEPGNDIEMKDRTSPKTLNDLNACGGESSTEHLKNSEIGKLLLLKDKLSPVMLLGHGEYGEIILAKTEELAGGNLGSVVMVKVLESNCENVISKFNDEVAMYSKMKHENVGTVLGLCEDALPQYAIMDYTDFGDLKQFLLATRPEGMSRALKQAPLSVAQNLMICRDIAVGMEYLSKHFIHKDLATRNILISSDFKIKVSCPCLSMDTYAQEYYHHESRILPLRWTPFEVIKEDKWSTKSDVWAFAIMVWEIFSKAELPYADMANEDIIQKLHVGKLTLSIPENMPSKLVKLMERCWSQNPNERPFFPEIAEIFTDLFIAAQM